MVANANPEAGATTIAAVSSPRTADLRLTLITGVSPETVNVAPLKEVAASRALGPPPMHTNLPTRWSLHGVDSYRPVAQLLMATLTIGDGVSCFARNLPALQTSTKLSLSVHGDLARIDYKIDDPTVRRRAQDANFSLGILHSILARLLGQRFRIVSVELEQLVRGAATAYQKYFSCPIRFGQATNAICFPANFLELPNPFADICIKKRLERELANQFARSDFIASVRAWMTAGFALSAPVDIECAAADFGMSPRSFQRKLSTMEVSYLDLRNEVRSQIARCMLADTSMPITTVALHLGYSEASAFSRYFRLQTGLSPAEFRARSWDAPADPA